MAFWTSADLMSLMDEQDTQRNCYRRNLNSVPKAVAPSEVWRSSGDASATPAPSSATSRHMARSDRQLFDALSRTPFVDSTELASILGEPHSTVHRVLTNLLTEGIVGRVSHGTAYLTSSQRYFITASGIRETARVLGFDTPSDFVRAYPMSREWLTLLMRRMDAVASVYRLAASMSPGTDGLGSRSEFHRRGRFDASITLHDGRSFWVNLPPCHRRTTPSPANSTTAYGRFRRLRDVARQPVGASRALDSCSVRRWD